MKFYKLSVTRPHSALSARWSENWLNENKSAIVKTKSAIERENFVKVMSDGECFCFAKNKPCAPVLYQVKIFKDRETEKRRVEFTSR